MKNMHILSMLVLICMTCQMVRAADAECASLKLLASRTDSRWQIELVNGSKNTVEIGSDSSGFGWTLYERKGNSWEVFASGGVGRGVGSAGASPTKPASNPTRLEPKGRKQLVTSLTTQELTGVELLPEGRYEAVFRYELHSRIAPEKNIQCSLASNAVVFLVASKK